MADQITSRQEFRDRVSNALTAMGKLIQQTRGHDPYESIEMQLDALLRWTADGREPTDEERGRINMGLIVIREFDPEPEQELYDVMQELHQIQAYVDVWPADGEAPFN